MIGKKIQIFLILLLIGFGTCDRQTEGEKVTIAIINARIWTANPAQPWVEAIAIKDSLISKVGSNKEILTTTTTSTRIIDAEEMMVTPGFIDAHVHILESGFRLTSVQLRDAQTPSEFTRRIREYAEQLNPGEWILGGDWDHNQWGGALPHRDWIDAITPHNPVWVNRLDGHMALANSVALKIAGVNSDTPVPEGGTIVRDSTGKITGILKDNAMPLVSQHIPEPSESQYFHALDTAMQYLLKNGVTSVHHMGTWHDLHLFEKYKAEQGLRVRISAAVPLATWKRLRKKIQSEGRGDSWLQIGGLKSYIDGSLGSHTALFHEPYVDKPDDYGLLVSSPDSLYRRILLADRAGLQSLTHAIGDKANSIILDIIEKVARNNGPRDRRFRIEHAQHIRPSDFARYKDLGVIASVQPYHAIDDGCWAGPLLDDERLKNSYAYKTFLDSGVVVAFGSDWYVAPPVPMQTIYAAVTRRTLDGKNPGGWYPEQKVSIEAALRCCTLSPAYAAFNEDLTGSLEAGKLADLVILNRDITRIPPEEIQNTEIVLTMVNGKIEYSTKR